MLFVTLYTKHIMYEDVGILTTSVIFVIYRYFVYLFDLERNTKESDSTVSTFNNPTHWYASAPRNVAHLGVRLHGVQDPP